MSTDYKVYQRRWLYLFVACLVNFSNGNTWISYAAITFYTNDFYGNNNATLLFNIIFMALSIPVGFLACWWTDRFGLRSATGCCAFRLHQVVSVSIRDFFSHYTLFNNFFFSHLLYRRFNLHSLHNLGGGVGLFNVLYNNLQPALCVKGYFPTFNGLMGTLLIMSGLIGSAITGIYVDKTGKFEQTMKISFLCAGLAACSLAISINYENVAWWIIISIFFFGVFAFAIYPIGLEMGVECTFPVPEATSTGLIIMMG
uniref:MFS domain-containing protein n=1 Tax=Heterorhabditis bacteriophora TaxID=37862 RepID=A0A1I7WLA0_HETBA